MANTRLLLAFAAASGLGTYLVPALVTGHTATIHPALALAVFAVLPAAVLVLMVKLRPGRFAELVAVVAPPLSALLGLLGCWITGSASMGSLMLFLVVVLFAAHQLYALPAAVTAVVTAASVCLLTFRYSTEKTALNDAVLVSFAIFAVTYLLISSRDRQEAMIAQLAELSEHDPLTGALTRGRIDELLEESAAAADVVTSLMLVDVNDFKSINDGFGHPAGDAVLIDVVRRLRDICSPDDAVGRFGGDEFVVVLNDPTSDAARERAGGLVALLEGEFTVAPAGSTPQVTYSLSVGVSHEGRRTAFAESLYSSADLKLYQSKSAHRVASGNVGRGSG